MNFLAQIRPGGLGRFGLLLGCFLALAFAAPETAAASGSATSPAAGTDGAWEKVLDGHTGGFSKVFLGTLGTDLYMFGSVGESAGDMKGVWRYRNGSWTRLATPSKVDFNGLLGYGAVEYKGKLYVGDRRAGTLFRLDLNCDGSFSALTPAAKVGYEDVLPGPVWNDKLWLGTFGNPKVPDNPGVYTYDDQHVTRVVDFPGIGPGGVVTSLAVWQNLLWVSLSSADGTVNEVWTVTASGVATRVASLGSVGVSLAAWNGGLYAMRSPIAPYTAAISVWSNGAFTDLSTISLGTPESWTGIFGQGDRLLATNYYSGIWYWANGALGQEGGGAWTQLGGEPFGGVWSLKYYDGYLYAATGQPVKLWRRQATGGPVPTQPSPACPPSPQPPTAPTQPTSSTSGLVQSSVSPSAGHMSIGVEGGLSARGLRYVFRGQTLLVSGSVDPFVPGQKAVIEVLRGGVVVSRQTVVIAPGSGGRGHFEAQVSAGGQGLLTIRARHEPTDQQAAMSSNSQPLRVVFWKAGIGARGTKVLLLQRGLRSLGFAAPVTGHFDAGTARAVIAFRKANSMRRIRSASPGVYEKIFRHLGRFRLRFPGAGRHVEFDWSRQVLVLAKGGRAARVYDASSRTPIVFGAHRFYRKQARASSQGMVNAVYFHRGLAVHGRRSNHRASSGGIGVAIADSRRIYDWISLGTRIFVYR